MSEQPAPKPVYYLPDRILLYVEHKATGEVDADKVKLARTVMAADDVTNWKNGKQLIVDPRDIVTFPGNNSRRASSVVPAAMPEGQVEAFVEAVFKQVKNMKNQTVPIADAGTDDEVLLTAVSPVWLMTSAPHGITHGGPGGLPVRAEYSDGQHCFTFPDMQISEPAEQGGQGVTVLILDTAPPDEAPETPDGMPPKKKPLDPTREDMKDHPLFQSLLVTDGGQLKQVHRDWSAELRATENEYGAGVNVYHMSDHGLFVAGIINSIAPRAELHLYEVLNRFGVGTFETIAEGLLCALEMRNAKPDNRLIVNCSLMLGAPEPHDGQPATDRPEILRDPEIYRYMNRPFQEIITQLEQEGITVVAAAGNDAHDESDPHRPQVRYPAAFDGAIAVGALPIVNTSNGPWNRASYSNESHRKQRSQPNQPDFRSRKDGYLTLGGERGKQKGVLGIYLDTFPECLIPPELAHENIVEPTHTFDHEFSYAPNDTGWAWWSGTSFATPIITGLLARTRAQHLNGQNNRAEDEAKLNGLARNGGPIPHEKVIFAKQG
jgi:hypothetical protein